MLNLFLMSNNNLGVLEKNRPEQSKTSKLTQEDRSATIAVTLFPVLIIAAALFGVFVPDVAKSIVPAVNPLLIVIMFCMGLTLRLEDFKLVFTRPLPVLVGVVAQYVIMPLVGWGVSSLLGLPPEIAAGVILVGCAPGGTASNVVAYLAKADTALSVTMTSISTLLAPIFTPILTLLLAGQYMPVDAKSMALSIVQIVLIPVVGGLVVRTLLPNLVTPVLPAMPWLSVVAISLVATAVVGNSADQLVKAGWIIFLAVILHNILGYLLGYGLGKVTKRGERASRTISIEVGMQNSALAAGLAVQYFSPAAALPAAVFSVWHNLSGALLAMFYRRSATKYLENTEN